MSNWIKNIKEEYEQTKYHGESLFMWFIHRKANDGIRQTIAYSLFFFSVYLWTDLRLAIFILEFGSLMYILICILEFFFKKD